MGHTILPASEGPISASTIAPPVFATKVDGYAYWNDTPMVETEETIGDGWIDGNNKWGPMLVAVAVIVTLVVVVAVLLYIVEQDTGPALELACELPTERPFMTVPTVTNMSINDASEAWAYAVQLFPAFSNYSLPDDPDPPWFIGEIDEVSIEIEPDGMFFYFGFGDSIPESPAPPFNEARDLGLEFIELHGGLGNYSLQCCFNMTSEDEHGIAIIGRSFKYSTTFNGLTIFGWDWINVIVYSDDIELLKRVHEFGEPGEPHKVIPASVAWDILLAEESDNTCIRGTRIIRVELCYYLEKNADETLTMYPTWRFVSDDIDFFIDAFTAERVGPIWI